MKTYITVTLGGFKPVTREVPNCIAGHLLAMKWARRGLSVKEVPYPVMANRPELIKGIWVYQSMPAN